MVGGNEYKGCLWQILGNPNSFVDRELLITIIQIILNKNHNKWSSDKDADCGSSINKKYEKS